MKTARNEMMHLLRRGFHSVVFQPICRLDDRVPLAFEALMRGPTGTVLSDPGRAFRDVAGDPRLLHELDAACLLAAVRLGRLFTGDHVLFVNMHGETIMQRSGAIEEIAEVMRMLAIPLDRIVLEISETTGHAHLRAIGRGLAPLREAGVRIALDDLGARYAWLHHVLRLAPEYLKLDRQFVRGLVASPRQRDVIAGIVRFAADVGAEVIVEGIEKESEREVLLGAGVTLGQGYLLGRPAPAQEWLPEHAHAPELTRVPGLVM